MTRATFLTALASLTLLLVPSAFAAGSVTPANGNDVVLPDGTVYQLGDDGAYHWIPDVATANAMQLNWSNLQPVDSLDGPVGDPIPDVASAPTSPAAAGTAPTAVRAVSVPSANGDDVVLPDGTVYQLGDDGSYHWIPDVATANAMHLDWSSLQPLDSLDAPLGDPIASVTG